MKNNKSLNSNNRKWLVWSFMALAFFFCYFHRYSLSVISNELTIEYNLSQVQLGLLASMYFYAYSLMQIPVGILCDKYNPGLVVTGGLIVAAIGSILFAFTQSLFISYFSRFIVGGGLATAFVSTFKIQTILFDKDDIPLMTGLTNTVGNFGALIATAPLAILVLFVGWRNMFLYLGIFTILLAIFIYFIVVKSQRNYSNEKSTVSVIEGIKSTLLNINTYPPLISLFFLGGSLFSFTSLWGMQYIMNIYGIEKVEASGFIMMLTLGVIVGGPLIGYITKHINSKKVLLSGSLIYALIWFLIIFIWDGYIPLSIAKPLFFTMGFSAISTLISFTILKESNNIKYVGIVASIGNMAPTFSTTVFNNFIGVSLSKVWSGTTLNNNPVYTVDEFKSAFFIYFICALIALLSSLYIYLKGKTKI